MNWMQNFVVKLFKITPAIDRQITIKEPLSHGGTVLKNKIWYRGDSSELDQYFKAVARDAVSKSRFWAATASAGLGIRKIHSGMPGVIVDKLADIVVADFDGIDFETDEQSTRWDDLAEDNEFNKLIGECVADVLITGDGAFKVSIDPTVTEYPILEFYSGDEVSYNKKRGRLFEVLFYTSYTKGNKDYRLEETYGKGYVTYKLFSEDGKEVALNMLEETTDLVDVSYNDEFIMAVPLMFFKSPKFKGRGKSIFDNKTESFDAFDEVISQWIDAIRASRVQKYIPEDLIPRDPETGQLMEANAFDNQFIKIQGDLSENGNKIDTIQAQINYEAFVESYSNALDMCLQGIVSPSTLGIDLKKTDNAESQREKEKATLHTRGKIVDALNEVLPKVAELLLKVEDVMANRTAGEYEPSVKFGEYASPSFDSKVETVGKARAYGVMSIERVVEEMYGDTWTDEEKTEEIERLKAEQGAVEVNEPNIKDGDE